MDIKKMVFELFELAMQVNAFERRGEVSGGIKDKPTIFFDYSGHVSSICMEIDPEGWKDGAGKKEFYFITVSPNSIDKQEYDICRARLEELLKKEKESKEAATSKDSGKIIC